MQRCACSPSDPDPLLCRTEDHLELTDHFLVAPSGSKNGMWTQSTDLPFPASQHIAQLKIGTGIPFGCLAVGELPDMPSSDLPISYRFGIIDTCEGYTPEKMLGLHSKYISKSKEFPRGDNLHLGSPSRSSRNAKLTKSSGGQCLTTPTAG